MRFLLLSVGPIFAAAFLCLALPCPVEAYIGIALQPIPEVVVLADVLVVGKITAKEEKTIQATVYPDHPNKYEMCLFELTTSDVLRGRSQKTYRVATLQPEAFTRPQFLTIDGKKRRLNPEVKVNVEGAFILVKHSTHDFYVVPPLGGFFDGSAQDYAKELNLLRCCSNLLSDPTKGLDSKNEEDRFLTAYMLVYDCCARPQRLGAAKRTTSEPITAELSKQVLDILLLRDWDGPATQKYMGPFTTIYPFHAVQHLKLNESSMKTRPTVSGFATEADIKEYRRWLNSVRDTARIQRVVIDGK
jgi:hypothetical protein